jgi:prepilin-type N-terminal cleavage/methylation domain-containing protein
MKGRSGSRAGFTMIELLTVIAIIAILVAILFPVFASVKRSVRLTSCMNNMHNISQAMNLYHDNWGTYPIVLDSFVVGGVTFHTLFPQYVKSQDVYRCPENVYPIADGNVQDFAPTQLTSTAQPIKRFPNASGTPMLCVRGSRWTICSDPASAACQVCQQTFPIQFPLRDSYDGTLFPKSLSAQYEIHYAPDWTEALPSAADVPRQLKYRSPPANTVVTWCLNHVSLDDQGVPQGIVPVLFGDGSVRKSSGTKFYQWAADGNTWRVYP